MAAPPDLRVVQGRIPIRTQVIPSMLCTPLSSCFVFCLRVTCLQECVIEALHWRQRTFLVAPAHTGEHLERVSAFGNPRLCGEFGHLFTGHHESNRSAR